MEPGGLASGPGASAQARACPLLDTHTPQCDRVLTKRKPFRTASDKRCFSRMMLGLKQPGRYYFWTLTSTKDSPGLKVGLRHLKEWLKRKYGIMPGAMWVLTQEGNGVIHIVIRLGMKQKSITHKEMSAFWAESHKAPIVYVKRVLESKKEDLANYLSDQRKKRGIGAEFSWQPMIVTWGWSKGWIPRGFTRQFGRFWNDWSGLPLGEREMWLHAWIQKCHKNQKVLLKLGVKMGRCYERPKVSDHYDR